MIRLLPRDLASLLTDHSAVITNMSDEAPLVARMRDALAGDPYAYQFAAARTPSVRSPSAALSATAFANPAADDVPDTAGLHSLRPCTAHNAQLGSWEHSSPRRPGCQCRPSIRSGTGGG